MEIIKSGSFRHQKVTLAITSGENSTSSLDLKIIKQEQISCEIN